MLTCYSLSVPILNALCFFVVNQVHYFFGELKVCCCSISNFVRWRIDFSGAIAQNKRSGYLRICLVRVVNDTFDCNDFDPAASALERAAKKFRWVSQIEAPDAPGFFFFGGEVHASDFGHSGKKLPVASLSGKGLSKKEAFEGCVGEGIEHLSRLEWHSEALTRGTADTVSHGLEGRALSALLEQLGLDAEATQIEFDWIKALRLSDHSEVLVPADLCLRRAPERRVRELPSAISSGCAAGPTREAAMLAALLELVERDAAALWWKGARRVRAVSLETLAQAEVPALMDQLRIGSKGRVSWLLDITTELEVPCFAAVSFNAEGRGFASGLAAGLNPKDAIRRAVLELCQIELGHHIVEAKRQVRGDAALNDTDRRKLLRSQTIDAYRCDRLHPAGPPRVFVDQKPSDIAEDIEIVVRSLGKLGIEPVIVDLTRPFLKVPVVRALAPGLQPFPSKVTTARLAAEAARNHILESEGSAVPLF